MTLCTSITRYLPFSVMAKDVYQFHSKGIEPIVNQMLILFCMIRMIPPRVRETDSLETHRVDTEQTNCQLHVFLLGFKNLKFLWMFPIQIEGFQVG